MVPERVSEFLRYDFTEDELREKSKNLALAVQNKTQAQEEQKAAASQFKELIENADAKIGKLSRDINMGWEMRTVDCAVLFHTPVQGTKRIMRLDTNKIVRDQAMLAAEMQENLFSPSAEESEENIRDFFSEPEAHSEEE